MNNLNALLNYAYDNVPYFNYTVNENNIDIDEIQSADDLYKIPCFDKETIKQFGWTNFVSQEHLDEEHNFKVDSGAHIERTTGTTGEPMHIPWNDSDYISSIKNHWKYRYEVAGILSSDKVCKSGSNKSKELAYNIDANTFYINSVKLRDTKIIEILDSLNQFQPEWLYLSSSLIYYLIEKSKENNLRFPNTIKYIELVGEPVLPFYKEKISEYFGDIPIRDMYGCCEVNGIAYECEKNHLHILDKNITVEIVDKKGNRLGFEETGNVCITGMHNTAMPMIRYKLNDIGILYNGGKCNCSNKSPFIKLKVTRLPYLLYLNDTKYCSIGAIIYPIQILKSFIILDSDILFNLNINSLSEYDVTFVLDKNQSISDVSKKFLEIIKTYGNQNINFIFSETKILDKHKAVGIIRLF